MKDKQQCYSGCSCEQPWEENTYYRCPWGTCCGYKCISCGNWLIPQLEFGIICELEGEIPPSNSEID